MDAAHLSVLKRRHYLCRTPLSLPRLLAEEQPRTS